jgi:hypothetical protein
MAKSRIIVPSFSQHGESQAWLEEDSWREIFDSVSSEQSSMSLMSFHQKIVAVRLAAKDAMSSTGHFPHLFSCQRPPMPILLT